MTVDTPFPQRRATPWLVSSRPTPLSGLGDETSQILNAITAGSIAANNTLNPPVMMCPAGTIFNPQIGVCQPGVTGTVSASGSSGLLILLALGAAAFFMMRRQ